MIGLFKRENWKTQLMNRFCDMINLVKWVDIQIKIYFFQNLSTGQWIKGWIENKVWILLQFHQIKPKMRMSQNMKSYIWKSPQQMFGAIAKSYFAEKLGVDRKDLVVVSIMPCLAKKYEASRPEFSVEGNPDVDYSIYTRELARLIRYANIDFNELPDGEFDRPLGESTGASVIFGTTGGVIEAACRTAYELYTKKNLDKVDFEELRGLEGIRSATIDFNGTPVKIGIAHGLGNARKLIEEVKNGTSPYHAIEVMACPGGCIGGGGQPFHRGRMEVLRRRAAALYREDANKPLRKSHENPYIQQLYSEYLGEPCGPKAHKLLHTHYIDRKEVIGMYIETEKSK